jgi:hypothetical protein
VTKRSQKRQSQGTTEAGNSELPSPVLPTIVPASNTPTKGPAAKVKAWAWRFTASYLWVRWLLTILNGRNVLAGAENAAANKIGVVLSFIGFAPSSGQHLGRVLMGIWLLFITSFSLIQLLLGLPVYVIVFPFVLLIVLIYRKELKEAPNQIQQSNVVPLPKRTRGFPVVPVAGTFLVAWFLLYGGSSARGPNLMGCVISGAVFLAFAYRALDKTSPIDEKDTAVFSLLALRGLIIMRNAAQKFVDSPPKNNLEAASSLRLNGFFVMPFRYLTVIFRGRRGRDRIAMLMLVEYIIFLIILALSAILFWALAIRTAVLPGQVVPLTTALGLSASHFLPGISEMSPIPLPWWSEFGPALTSWVLFVVYIGAVGAALPPRQEAFLRQIAPLHKSFRLVGKLWHVYRRHMKGYVVHT